MPAAGTRRYEIDNNQAGRRGVVKTSKREMLTRPSRNDHESGRAFVRGAGPLLHRIALGFAASLLACVTALAQPPLWPMDQWRYPNSGLRDVPPPPAETEPDPADTIPQHLRRQVVSYATREVPGTIVIDTPNTYLYQVEDGGRAIRYGIGVGREGFTWSGTRVIDRKVEWPDWAPPPEMIARQPYLPRFMAGGPGNPLGARAMYLSGTLYRIHGTSEPSSIGKRVSSGCIRMLNEDVIDLYERTPLGTKVVVLPDLHHQPVVIGNSGDPRIDQSPIADVPYFGPSKSINNVYRRRN